MFRANSTLSVDSNDYTGDRPDHAIVVLIEPIFKRDPLIVKQVTDHIPAPGIDVRDSLQPDECHYYKHVQKVNDGCYQAIMGTYECNEILGISFDD